jgi:exodeoxyribonuclease V beta subunit
LREQIRLLYVAVTRARHAVWVGAAHIAKGGKAKTPTSAWHLSALGVLVSGREEISADKRRADWEHLAERRSEMQLTWMPASTEGPPWPGVTALQAPGQAASLAPAKVYTASFDRHWAVSSYSGLVKQLPGAMVWQTDAVTRTTLRDDEPAREDTLPSRATDGLLLAPHAGDRISTSADPASCESNSVWHAFPKGASAGNFLHELLESLADEQFRVEDGDEWVAQVQGRCERSEFKDQGPVVVSWLRALCSTPLPPVGASLSQLVTVAPEMEFWLPSDDLPVGQLDQLCRAHILSGQIRQPLNQQVLRGMFMGFADLVFEHEGRYWVLDYKSNHLGTRDADYTAAAMGRAMLQHRYDVQAAIYLLALHRLLRARLGAAYAPGQHLGGALYVFMRGIAGAQAGCFHVSATPTWIDALDALLTPMPKAAPMAENT